MSSQNYKVFWEEALKQLSEEYKSNGKEDDFKFWFKMEYVEDENNIIRVNVPSDFMRDQMISKGYVEQIITKICQMTGQNEIKIESIITNAPVSPAEEKEEPKNSSESKPAKQSASSAQQKNTEKGESAKSRHPQLLEKYTFDTFVCGENNNFAYSAALAAAKNPGKSYNPILLYGGVGLGKTHLMQSVGNYIYEHSESKVKICCVPAETFFNEFTDSLKNNTPNKFKNKYRNLDVLLLDDIHFLQNKKALQEETFHTFNALNEHGAQMVFTCDRPINEIEGIEERLKTRFSSGVCIDMQPPSYEVRCAIIKKKLEILGKKIEEDVIDFIAKNIQMNVRDLEAAIKTVVGYQDLINTKVTVEIAKEILKDTITNATGNYTASVSMDTILKVIADTENTSITDIKGKKRDKKIAETRHIAVYITRELLEYSFTELGAEFGGKDHSTMISAYNKIADRIKTDPSFSAKINSIIKAIKEYKKA